MSPTPYWILEHGEHPGQEVADEALRAEPDGDPDDPGVGQDRAERYAELGQHHDRGYHQHDHEAIDRRPN